MKQLLSVLVVALMVTTATAQDLSRLYSRPAVPPREVLDRLNLTLGWYAYVPTDGVRDRIFSIQLTGQDILVQMRSGAITSLEPETGRVRWGPIIVGLPYRHQEAIGYNSRLLFVANGSTLYAVDRRNGQQQWSYELPGAPIAPVGADEEQIYASLSGGRVRVFRMVTPQQAAVGGYIAKPITGNPAPGSDRPELVDIHGLPPPPVDLTGPYGGREYVAEAGFPPPQVLPVFFYETENTVERAPLVSPEVMMLSDALGNLLGMSKYRKLDLYTLKTGGPITAQPGQHGELAYAPSADRDLYTVNMVTGRVLWRFTSPLPVYATPAVTDADVYVSPSGAGLYRLDRPSGQLLWRSPEAQHFLAANPKFVYATDRSDRLLVLDGRRGTVLSGYDTRDFVVPVSNDLTDRVYLAANNGLIVCLHDREYATPLRTKYALAQPPGPAKKPTPKPPAEAPKPKGAEGDMEKPR